MKSVAVIILNYKTGKMTDQLYKLMTELDSYENKDVYVFNNGPDDSCKSACHTFEKNIHFTNGSIFGYEYAKSKKDYDAYWFCNSDISFKSGDVLKTLVEILFSSDEYAQISPRYEGSPFQIMGTKKEIAKAAFLESTCPLIKKSTIDKVGFWDKRFIMGWGQDFDHGYKIRKANLKNIVTSKAEVVHLRNASQENPREYADKAQQEMNLILSEKYGSEWRRIITTMEEITIVVSTFGQDFKLKTLINCFKSQTYDRWKMIIIHDGPAPAKLKKSLRSHGYISDDFNITFIETKKRKNQYGHNSRKLALEHYVDTEWVLLTNGDNYYCPVFLEKMFEASQEKDVVMCNFIHSHRNWMPFRSTFDSGSNAGRKEIKRGIDIGAFMVKSSIAKDVGFNHIDFCADGKFVEDIKRKFENINVGIASPNQWSKDMQKNYLFLESEPSYLFIHN